MIKKIKTILLLLSASTIYAQVTPPLIQSEGNFAAPIAVDADTVYVINAKAELQTISGIKIPKALQELAEVNAQNLISNEITFQKKHTAKRTGGNDRVHIFASKEQVAIINGTNPNIVNPHESFTIYMKDRPKKISIYEVTYEIYRKNINTSKSKTAFNVMTISRPNTEILKMENDGISFRNWGPFITTENTWVKEKYYTILHPKAVTEFMNLTCQAHSGFIAIRNITYNPVKNPNNITLYTDNDLRKFNIFQGNKKRKQEILENGNLLIESLEPYNSQKIKIGGAVPRNSYKINVEITFKGGEIEFPLAIKNALEFQKTDNLEINTDGFKKINYTYIDSKRAEAHDFMLTLKLNPLEKLQIKHLAITANKI